MHVHLRESVTILCPNIASDYFVLFLLLADSQGHPLLRVHIVAMEYAYDSSHCGSSLTGRISRGLRRKLKLEVNILQSDLLLLANSYNCLQLKSPVSSKGLL